MKDMYTVIYQIYLAFLWTSLFNFNYIIIVPSIEKYKSQEKNNYVLRNESQLPHYKAEIEVFENMFLFYTLDRKQTRVYQMN